MAGRALRRALGTIWLPLSLGGHVLTGVAGPPNDQLALAAPITRLAFADVEDTHLATDEVGEVRSECGRAVQRGIWYRFTPESDGEVVLDTLGSNFDTVLSVWATTAGGGERHPLWEIACDDDHVAGGSWSRVAFAAKVGTAYLVKLAGFDGATGQAVLNARAADAPRNDDVHAATGIATLPYSTTLTTEGSTTEADEPSSDCGSPPGGGVWFDVRAPEDGTLALLTENEDFVTTISVWSREATGALRELACDNGYLDEPSSSLLLAIDAGEHYLVRVEGDGGKMGAATFRAWLAAPPANPSANRAVVVDDLPSVDRRYVTLMEEEQGDVGSRCLPGSHRSGAWYRVDPDRPTAVLAETRGSTFETALSMWTRAPDGRMTEVACNAGHADEDWARLAHDLTAGASYFIRVDAVGLEAPVGALHLGLRALDAPPPNDDWAAAIRLDTLPFIDVRSTFGATSEPGGLRSDCAEDAHEHGLWYTFRPAAAASIVVSSRGSDVDTILSVWTGGQAPAEEIACADGRPVAGASLVWHAAAGRTYWIKASSPDDQVGEIALHVSAAVRPPNDELAQAVEIGGLPFADEVATHAAQAEPDEPAIGCGIDSALPAVWYRYAPGRTAAVLVDTRGSSVDTVLTVWVRDGGGRLSRVSCSDDLWRDGRIAGDWSRSVFLGEPGSVYFIQVASTEPGRIRLAVGPAPVPRNDDLADAVAVLTLPFRDRQDLTFARDEPGEAAATCGDMDGFDDWDKGIWYHLPPARSGSIAIAAREVYQWADEGDIALTISVWSSVGDRPPTQVACDAGGEGSLLRVRLEVEADRGYFVKVAVRDGAADGLVEVQMEALDAAVYSIP